MADLAPEAVARTEKQLGAVLRDRRRRADLSQASLGERAHLRQSTISRLEAGEPAMQLHSLIAVLAALDLELVVRPRQKTDASIFEEMF